MQQCDIQNEPLETNKKKGTYFQKKKMVKK